MIRWVKVLLVFAVALWGFVGALHNILNWEGTLGAVKAATSMTTFEGGAESWQATEMAWVVWMGALFIVVSKILVGVLCVQGLVSMIQQRNHNVSEFNQAKQKALAGCGIAVFMLFFGFVVVAESWFEMWQSDAMRGPVLDSAFRYACLIALVALFVASDD